MLTQNTPVPLGALAALGALGGDLGALGTPTSPGGPGAVFIFLPEKKKIEPEKIFNILPEKFSNWPRKKS